MRELLINGVPMRDPAGKYFVDYTASTLLSDVSRSVTSGSAFGYHGDSPEVDNYFGSGRETLVLNVMGDTLEEHGQLVWALQGLFSRKDFTVIAAPQRSPLAAGSGRVGRSFNVASSALLTALMRMNGSVGVERLNETTAKLTFVLENIYGFWRSQDQFTSASVPLTTTPQTIDLASITGDSNMPITDGMMRIKGPLTSVGRVIAYDRSTLRGAGYRAAVALLDTEYILLDFLTLKATKVTTDTWDASTGTDLSNRVELMGEGTFSLEPGDPVTFPGSFYYGARIVSSGITSGNTAVQFRVRRSYS